jgi:hypothetical protein
MHDDCFEVSVALYLNYLEVALAIDQLEEGFTL